MVNGECSIVQTSSERRLRAVYPVRGSVWSLLFVEPHKRDRPKKLDAPAPATRREMIDCKADLILGEGASSQRSLGIYGL